MAASCSAVSTPSATIVACQREASSWRARSTAYDGSWRMPPWTSDRSILTMSNWISDRSRRPALPAPTSSAARRMPAARQAAALRRSPSRSLTSSRSVSSTTSWDGWIPRRSKMDVSSRGWNSSDSSVRGDRLTLR